MTVGLIALCSIGPIIVTMILSLFIDPSVEVSRNVIVNSTELSFVNLFIDFGNSFLTNAYEIIIILAPIAIIFFTFNAISLKLPKTRISKIVIGLIYTYLGLILFLTGVFAGYLKIASIIGYQVALNYDYLLIPLSLLFGVVIILAEPSIFILGKKIEEITNGVIRKKS